MNVASLFDYKTSAEVRIDAPIESTVRIPLHRGRIVWRMLCAVAIVIFSAYTLIHQALDYEPRRDSSALDVIGQHDMRNVPADKRQVVETAVSYARAVQKYTRDYGREWRMFVTVVAMLTAIFAGFREIARLQSAEPGMVVSPAGLTINCDASHRVVRRIPWTSLIAIEDRNYKGVPSVAIKLRDAERYLVARRFFSKFNSTGGEARIVVSPRSLQINWQDLKKLLVRYFDAYGTDSSKR